MLTSIINDTAAILTFTDAMLCLLTAILIGGVISVAYMLCGKYSKSFVVSLVILPVLVQIVIMLVNGNLGTGMAVLGAFSLVRFRSVPGSAREICAIFLAMAAGLATGMGYLVFALIITVIVCAVFVLLSKTSFGERPGTEKELKITIPENLDYTDVFSDLFEEYTKSISLEMVKTTNLGSMYQLSYLVSLKEEKREKEFIDALRCRNGNLTIMMGRQMMNKEEL